MGVLTLPRGRTPTLTDRAFRYGDGLFETIRAYEGRSRRLDEHLRRLRSSLGALAYPDPDNVLAGTEADIAELLRGLVSEDAAVRVVISRGDGDPFADTDDAWRVIDVSPLSPTRPPKPVRLVTISGAYSPGDALRAHKTTSFVRAAWARRHARSEGADDALYVSCDGEVGEATTSNCFAYISRVLVTPPLGAIIAGITRADVMLLAHAAGLAISERVLTCDELRAADEVFLTSSLAELVPATAIDGRPVGCGRPGPVWTDLYERYTRQIRSQT